MKIYNFSEARQNFARVLNTSLREVVIIERKDGSRFQIVPLTSVPEKSPLDVPGVDSNVTKEEILSVLREVRER
mgnify:CR=1 FL=1